MFCFIFKIESYGLTLGKHSLLFSLIQELITIIRNGLPVLAAGSGEAAFITIRILGTTFL